MTLRSEKILCAHSVWSLPLSFLLLPRSSFLPASALCLLLPLPSSHLRNLYLSCSLLPTRSLVRGGAVPAFQRRVRPHHVTLPSCSRLHTMHPVTRACPRLHDSRFRPFGARSQRLSNRMCRTSKSGRHLAVEDNAMILFVLMLIVFLWCVPVLYDLMQLHE